MTTTRNTQPAAPAVIARQLWFVGEQQVAVREQTLPAPAAGELLVETICSSVSAGTELLVYRGQIPQHMSLDASRASLQHAPTYPLQYGYASVGRIIRIGAGLATEWQDKLVFAFQPHASHFITSASSVIPLPEGIDAHDAVFLANMETAVNLVQDGSPALGERVVVLGQGIVGLLLSSLLAKHPLAALYALDGLPARRGHALQLGVNQVFDPGSIAQVNALKQHLSVNPGISGVDLVYEVSGVPEALNLAIDLCGYASRIVIGSWYGSKSAAIALGGDAHRNRLKITTSQVSSLAPELSGRWDKARRFALTWEVLKQVKPSQLITHRVPLDDAAALYQQLHQQSGDIVQAVFVYPS
jgi:2-desacetyl-2-hydroxyethyl bacteriochlorophyllide A dehydrogenase